MLIGLKKFSEIVSKSLDRLEQQSSVQLKALNLITLDINRHNAALLLEHPKCMSFFLFLFNNNTFIFIYSIYRSRISTYPKQT